MKNLSLLCLILLGLNGWSQSAVIDGTVLEYNGTPLDFASAVLYAASDSSIVKAEFTDAKGKFAMYGVASGTYYLGVNFVGIPDYYGASFDYEIGMDKSLGDIVMSSPDNTLNEVIVTTTRPLLEMKPDKMVFNVDGSINATGSDALELLRKSPGVVVDNNDNITLMGKNGVKIFIDGRPSPLSPEDLAAYLRILQADQIDAIEVITNPSAKYEAEGNAGIINIRLKRNENIGSNGSLSGGFQQGQKSRYNGSFQANHRTKGTNFFGSYNYYDGATVNDFFLYREQFGLRFDQSNLGGGSWRGHNYRAGIDVFIDNKHTFGVLANGNTGSGDWGMNSRTVIGPAYNAGLTDSLLLATSNSAYDRYNHNLNLNYKFDNGEGTTLNVDLDAGIYDNMNRESLPNRYTSEDETTILRTIENFTEAPTNIHIYTGRIDLQTGLFDGQLGLGGKYSFVETDNTFDFYDVVEEEHLINPDQSNNFVYQENVNALYFTYSRQWSEWSINFGVRMEHTHSLGTLTAMVQTGDEEVERDYLDFFPSGGISYKPNEKHSFQLNYSRRLRRPNYQDLNPFRSKLDELTFELGNPFLRPEYAANFQLSHSFNYRFTTSIGYSHTRDGITRFTDVEGQKSSFITWLNLSDQYNYNVNFSMPISITSSWSSYTSITGFIQENKADYGNGRIVDLSTTALNIYSQQTFSLPDDWSLEVSGWYQSPSLWGGTFEMDAMYNIDVGVQKKIAGGMGNVKLSVSDIFWSTKFDGVSTYGDLFLRARGNNDSRRVRLNFTYNFGNQKIKTRKRSTGLEEEKNRINNDS